MPGIKADGHLPMLQKDDNWTSFGPLFSHLPDGVRPLHIKLNEVWGGGEWHEQVTRIAWSGSIRNVLSMF